MIEGQKYHYLPSSWRWSRQSGICCHFSLACSQYRSLLKTEKYKKKEKAKPWFCTDMNVVITGRLAGLFLAQLLWAPVLFLSHLFILKNVYQGQYCTSGRAGENKLVKCNRQKGGKWEKKRKNIDLVLWRNSNYLHSLASSRTRYPPSRSMYTIIPYATPILQHAIAHNVSHSCTMLSFCHTSAPHLLELNPPNILPHGSTLTFLSNIMMCSFLPARSFFAIDTLSH